MSHWITFHFFSFLSKQEKQNKKTAKKTLKVLQKRIERRRSDNETVATKNYHELENAT